MDEEIYEKIELKLEEIREKKHIKLEETKRFKDSTEILNTKVVLGFYGGKY
jgi:hypothetical protein